MKILKLYLVALAIALASSQAPKPSQAFCSKEEQGTLEVRVNAADVVITGTVTRVDTESLPSASADSTDVDEEPGSEGWSPRQTIGLVKLWHVVKGSLAHVENQTSGPQDLLSDVSSNPTIHNPVIKLYGLWNDLVCGSYVGVGDTRIFFLKKFEDFRSATAAQPAANNNPELKAAALLPAGNLTEMGHMYPPSAVGEVMMVPAGNDTDGGHTVREADAEKRRNKKKKKGGKKKKKRKGKKSKKSGKNLRGKKARRKRRKTSESVRGMLENLRSKRSSEPTGEVSDLTEIAEEPRSVLVVIVPPARITLANLNKVEELSRIP